MTQEEKKQLMEEMNLTHFVSKEEEEQKKLNESYERIMKEQDKVKGVFKARLSDFI